MATRKIEATINSANTFSSPLRLERGDFNFSISGTWDATVVVQRSFDKGITWHGVEEFYENGEYVGYEPEEGVYYRFGVTTYNSGIIVGRLAQE